MTRKHKYILKIPSLYSLFFNIQVLSTYLLIAAAAQTFNGSLEIYSVPSNFQELPYPYLACMV